MNRSGMRVIRRRQFFRCAGLGTLGAALAGRFESPASARALPTAKVDHRKLKEFPTLSLKERDRRWTLVRKLMQDNKVDAVLAPPDAGEGGLDGSVTGFFSNDTVRATIFFPREGEPIAFMPNINEQQADYLMRSEAEGQVSWIRDWRFQTADLLHELERTFTQHKLTASRIGTLAMFGRGPRTQATRTSPIGTALKRTFPKATFVELYDQFVPQWLVKSDEELAMFRKGAIAQEVLTEAFIAACKPGNTVVDVDLAVVQAVAPYGISQEFPGFSLYTGPHGGRGSRWLGRGLPPLVIKKGDLVCSEYSSHCGPIDVQVQIAVSVGEPTKQVQQLAKTAREAYEIGLRAIRPGVTFGAVCDAMNAPNVREGFYNLTPHLHTMNPNTAVSMIRERFWEGYTGLRQRFGEQGQMAPTPTYRADLVLQEGMTLAFEPNASRDLDYVNIGGNVLVTKMGTEELNDLPNRLVVVDA